MQSRDELVRTIEDNTESLADALKEYLQLENNNIKAKNNLFEFMCWKLHPIFPLDMPAPRNKHTQKLTPAYSTKKGEGNAMLRVKTERLNRKWTLKQVADKTGIDFADLSKLERGLYRTWPGWWKRLAEIYNIPEKDLQQEV